MARSTKTENKKQYGLNVKGLIKVFAKEIEYKAGKETNTFMSHWLSLGRKEEDGTYTNASMKVFFKKDDDPDGTCLINVKDGWLTVSGNDDFVRVALFISDYDIVEE